MFDPQKALNYQRALATFARIVGEADSDQRLLQNATAQIARITHIRHVKVLRYRPDQGDLLIEAGVGWKPGVVGHVSFGADRHSSPGRSPPGPGRRGPNFAPGRPTGRQVTPNGREDNPQGSERRADPQ